MSENSAASDWVGPRGERWSVHLAGMEAMLAPVDDPLVSALRLDAAHRIADVGCGGGGTTRAIARLAPPGSVVHGFDISAALVKLARERRRPGDGAVTFDVADVAQAKPERPYDRLVSRFGVMFFPEPPSAFANLFSWLAPGGRLAFAVWGGPSANPWLTTVRDVVAGIVDLPPSDPAAPGPFRYARADDLLSLLAGAGFGDLASHDWHGALPLGGGLPAAEAARFALASFASFGDRLAEAGDAALAEAHRALTARLSPYERDGAVRMEACVHVITGARVE